jgi:hypothetical protein
MFFKLPKYFLASFSRFKLETVISTIFYPVLLKIIKDFIHFKSKCHSQLSSSLRQQVFVGSLVTEHNSPDSYYRVRSSLEITIVRYIQWRKSNFFFYTGIDFGYLSIQVEQVLH